MIRVKVCGMRDADNISQIAALRPDYMGFIFYSGSKRFVSNDFKESLKVPGDIKTVGVFVNEDPKRILQIAAECRINLVQLHGTESPETCSYLRSNGLGVIKAFGIDPEFNFRVLDNYVSCCDYFLFDTKTAQYGGSGEKFSWELIDGYNHDTPFFISGGIGADDADRIAGIMNPKLVAVDINSGFEKAPGIKDIPMVARFIDEVRAKSKL